MNTQLQKVINLARKTGDRLIVYDSQNPNNAYVVVSINEYEKIIDSQSKIKNLTEAELLDKINREIAIWKNENNNESFSFLSQSRLEEDNDRFFFEDNDEGEEEEDYEEEFAKEFNRNYFGGNEKKKKGKGWKIPESRKREAEEVVDEEILF